jgi:hypothetical protein
MKPVHWSLDTSWDDPTLEWHESPSGIRSVFIGMGSGDGDDEPMAALIQFPSGHVVRPHNHTSEYCSTILNGSMRVTGRAHGPGAVRFVGAKTGYGPLVAGDEGCTILEVFAHRSGVLANYFKLTDAERRSIEVSQATTLCVNLE